MVLICKLTAARIVQRLNVASRENSTPADLSFSAQPGQVTVLSGDNGSGKSTVLLALLGQLPSELVEGTITAPELEDIAYLPARPVLVDGTVYEDLSLFGWPASAEIGVEGTRELVSSARGVSAGQAERIGVARALSKPGATTLLLDEPTAHLSPELVRMLTARLQERAARGDTVLIASHDPRVLEIADRVVRL